jgi:hypothetical protein
MNFTAAKQAGLAKGRSALAVPEPSLLAEADNTCLCYTTVSSAAIADAPVLCGVLSSRPDSPATSIIEPSTYLG